MHRLFISALIALSATCLLSATNLQSAICNLQPDKTDSIKEEGFRFTTVDSVAITPVKNQHRSSTCWSFSGISFLESEILRTKGLTLDLAEMFVVSHTMQDRAVYTMRQYGDGAWFAPGGQINDVIVCMDQYGLCPQEAMPGIRYAASKADTLPVHKELDAVAGAFINALKGMKTLSPVWREAFQSIYDTYLGACPESFSYGGKTYTPRSFADYLGLHADDYVTITSYTHHPFYTRFAIEVPDNWRMEQAYNVPLDELMAVIDNAIRHGYTLGWSADVSELGFSRKGIAVVPDADNGADLTGSDMAHWLGMSDADKKAELTKYPMPELEITQEMRQQAYDSWGTTDDHGMHIFGTATDQNGKPYFMVKNSWGTVRSDYHGIWYVSRAFMAYKTNSVTLHKDALPKDLRKKLGIK